MPFHRYEPSNNPDDHLELSLETADNRPDAPAAPASVGPHDPTAVAPGVVFTPQGAVAVSKDQARLRKEAACPDCGYSIVGLTSERCPECGVELIPALRAAARRAKQREGLVREYTVAGVALGIAVLALSAITTLAVGPIGIPFMLLQLVVLTPLAFVAYLICCTLWIGFDMPLGITALRLAATFSWTFFTWILSLMIFPYVPIVGLIFTVVVLFSLLKNWLEIESLDALGLTFATIVVGITVVVLIT